VLPGSAHQTTTQRRSGRQWLALAALAAALAAAGCPHGPGAGGTKAPHQPPAATAPTGPAAYPLPDKSTDTACFAFIGDFRTFLRPCGCTPDQPGGMPRLGTILQTGRALLSNISAQPKGIAPDTVDQLRAGLGLPEPLSGSPAKPRAPNRLWLVECGNFNWIGVHNQDIRLSTYLNILSTIGCRAIVPGAGELELSAADAKALAASAVPVVSCNLTLKQPLFPLQQSVELAPGWYVTGVSSWDALGRTTPQGSWWELTDPVAAVKTVLAGVPPRSKLVVVAAYQPQAVVDQLAKLPLAIIVGDGHWPNGETREASGRTELPPMPLTGRAEVHAPVELPAPPPRGAFLPLVRLYSVLDTLEGDTAFVSVDQHWPDEAAVQALLDQQTASLRDLYAKERAEANKAYGDKAQFGMEGQFLPEGQQTLTAEQLTKVLQAPARYKGSAACIQCHAAAGQTWKASVHAGALDTLTAHQEENNLDCLQCHTVGLYEPSGYDPNDTRTAPHDALGAVGCESCHGPGSQHVAAAQLAKLQDGAWPKPDEHWNGEQYSIVRSSLTDCLKCHDSYNSPKFNAQGYWAKIKH
jgi:hypothetical protein